MCGATNGRAAASWKGASPSSRPCRYRRRASPPKRRRASRPKLRRRPRILRIARIRNRKTRDRQYNLKERLASTADVAKLADTPSLGGGGEIRASSSLHIGTKHFVASRVKRRA